MSVKIELMYSASRRAKPKVHRRLCGVGTTEVEVHMAIYSLFATDHRRQVAHKQYKSSFDHNSG